MCDVDEMWEIVLCKCLQRWFVNCCCWNMREVLKKCLLS